MLKSLTCTLGLGASMMLAIATPVLAEGSYQLGPNKTNGQSWQGLFEYNASYDSPSNVGFTRVSRPIYVDVLTAGEVINISACGYSFGDDWEVDIYYVGADIADFTDPRSSYPPSSGSLVFGQAGNASSSAANYRRQGSFGTSGNNSSCTTFNQLTNVATSGDGRSIKYQTTQAGVYEIRLFNRSQTSSSREIFRQFDISITPNTSTTPDPTQNLGRVWSFIWGFNAGDYELNRSTDANLYVRVPGGFPGTNYVWELDLNDFAGYVYELVANQQGVNSPNTANLPVAGLSVDISGNSLDPRYRQYLSYPENVNPEPSAGDVVIVDDFRFVDNAGIDNTISPGTTSTVQDSGFFKFTTNIDGTYVITIDVDDDGQSGNGFNPDGVFGVGDITLRGETSANNEVVIEWDGRTNLGELLPDGTYQAQLQAIVGEYHFVAADVENSGSTSQGLTINRAVSQSTAFPTNVYWDDITGLDPNDARATATIPNGQLSGRHTWGLYANGTEDTGGSGFGNLKYIDTHVYGKISIANTPVILTSSDEPITSNPNVLLVKRITLLNGDFSTLNGDDLAAYIDEAANAYDDNTITITADPVDSDDPPKDTGLWPDPATFLIGGINGGDVRPEDELEYTIYFLSAGGATANNVMMCDRVPDFVDFLPNIFNVNPTADLSGNPTGDRGIVVGLGTGGSAISQFALTNEADGDLGYYFPPGVDPAVTFPNIYCGGTNTNGAVVVNLGALPNATSSGDPAGSYGFVRFRARVR